MHPCISPEREDFKTLRPITPHPIKGFGGACVYAVGIGSIELCIASSKHVVLNHALFVSNVTIYLISVFMLNCNGQNACHFDTKTCCVINNASAVVLTSKAWVPRRLYVLNCISPSIMHAKSPPNNANVTDSSDLSALYATWMSDVKTWHRHLKHCNNQTIIDMAHQGVVEGMLINLSSAPAVCDHCILGKQTQSTVSKVCEGVKAEHWLEHVFIDLCGPMPCVSKSSHLFSMNIIDDFSGYVWSLPLRSKSEAAPVLCAWHCTVENHSGERLKTLITDNGELVFKSMSDWCFKHGIAHDMTAPYTSAQNGCAQRLCRTLLRKAWAMCLACNAPATLWDEFCATLAYLTNLTASSSIQGQMPFKLWFGQKPSLSHLQEIGCRAFALIQTHNPKIYQWLTPCTLIGYAPHMKAYCLWDITTGKVFNSFHITFIKHLHAQPTNLLPGTTIELNPNASPTWDSTPPIFSKLIDKNYPPTNLILPSFPPIIPKPNPLNIKLSPQQNITLLSSQNSQSTQSSLDTNTLVPSIIITPPKDSSEDPVPASTHRHRICLAPTFPPHHSPCFADLQPDDGNHSLAFLSEYAPLCNSHNLFPLDFPSDSISMYNMLSTISDGSLKPDFDTGDDLSWAEAMHSPNHEYWIAGAHKELCSLKDLKVFVLIPHSDIP